MVSHGEQGLRVTTNSLLPKHLRNKEDYKEVVWIVTTLFLGPAREGLENLLLPGFRSATLGVMQSLPTRVRHSFFSAACWPMMWTTPTSPACIVVTDSCLLASLFQGLNAIITIGLPLRQECFDYFRASRSDVVAPAYPCPRVMMCVATLSVEFGIFLLSSCRFHLLSHIF